jgi:membrane peptidoglycan carboxypeptidase
MPSGDNCVDQRIDAQGQVWCRSCDLSMGLGSSSLTMVELARAYSAFATYGHLVEPHWIDRVVDRDGTVIEQWTKPESWPEVMSPSVAGIANWMLHEVATGGTAAKSNQLGLHVAARPARRTTSSTRGSSATTRTFLRPCGLVTTSPDRWATRSPAARPRCRSGWIS